MKALETHPLAELIPNMSELEYQELAADIAANGLREAITLYEGKILDGRHRARACQELGIKLKTQTYEGDDPARYVISLNVHRRHLTTTQRAEIALAALPHYKEQAKRRQQEGRELGAKTLTGQMTRKTSKEDFRARDAAAADVGVAGITVARLERVEREAPDLHEQVKTGEKTVSAAWREVRERAEQNGKPTPTSPVTKRQRDVAQAVKRRVETLVGTCQGLTRGLPDLRVENAAQVATTEEVEGWAECIRDAEAALRKFRKRITSKEKVYA